MGVLNEKRCKNLSNVKKYKREVPLLNSRFDFVGIDENDNKFILEVKSVPLADYEDISKKDRKNKDYSTFDYYSKIAYFPDGYRKNNKCVVSERALKHINELELISKSTKIRSIICYVIQRDDVDSFQISLLDPIYKKAVQNALTNGVEIFTIVLSWKLDQHNNANAYFKTSEININDKKDIIMINN